MQSYMIIGWFFITGLYIALHHVYNWIARTINDTCSEDDNIILQFVAVIIYLLLNMLYFSFTYGVFNNWK